MNIAHVRRTVAEIEPQARSLSAVNSVLARAQAAQQSAHQQIGQAQAAARALEPRPAPRLPGVIQTIGRSSRASAQTRREQASARQIRPPRILTRQQPQSVAPEQAVSPPNECYLSREGQVYGPYNWPQLQQYASSGQIAPTDMLWLSERQEWVQAAEMPGLW